MQPSKYDKPAKVEVNNFKENILIENILIPMAYVQDKVSGLKGTNLNCVSI